MITSDGWNRYCTWEHSSRIRKLYRRRCRLEAEEMTCAAQAAELLAPRVRRGETVLDAGCGSGYFYHSLRKREIPAEYLGIDAAPSLIAIGRKELRRFGLPAQRLRVLRIEDLDGAADHVVCLNVLSNLDNYHRPLERLLRVARKSLILRESLKQGTEYRYIRDRFLDPGVDLKVHVKAYDLGEVTRFIRSQGFRVRRVVDRHSGDRPERVIGYPHWWTFLVADRARRRRSN